MAGKAVNADTYFAGLTEQAIGAYLRKYPNGFPHYVYEDYGGESQSNAYDEEEHVAVYIQRMRRQFQPDAPVVDNERKVFLKYRNMLRGLSDYMAIEGLGRATFRRSLNSELGTVEQAINADASLGSARAAKNHRYNQAGSFLASLLSSFGLPYANREAALFLWHCGWGQRANTGKVEVIDPFRSRNAEPGKDPRDPLEKEAHKRWHRKRKDKGTRSQYGLSLARMMRAARKTRRDEN